MSIRLRQQLGPAFVSGVVACLALPALAAANTNPTAGFIFEPSTPGVNEQITFSSTATDPEGPIPAASQRWDFDGDGQFDDAIAETVTYSFDSPGTKPVSLEVTDSDGATAVATRGVVVQANPPAARFVFSPGSPLSNETVAFDGAGSAAASEEAITSMRWDLDGDGEFNDASGPTASAIYPTPGPHTVGLRVESSGGGIDIATSVVGVRNRAPNASVEIIPKQPRAGDTVRMTSTSTDPDGPIADFAWDLDDDGEYDDSTRRSPDVTFPHQGVFNIGLIVHDTDGVASEVRRQIVIGDPRLGLLTPFPVVRLTGSVRPNGMTRIDRLSVQAPTGSKVTVRCRGGHSCPFSEQHHTVANTRARFPAIAKVLEPGVVISVFVTKPDKVGKFTSFRLHAARAPERFDRCLQGASRHPIHCPRT